MPFLFTSSLKSLCTVNTFPASLLACFSHSSLISSTETRNLYFLSFLVVAALSSYCCCVVICLLPLSKIILLLLIDRTKVFGTTSWMCAAWKALLVEKLKERRFFIKKFSLFGAWKSEWQVEWTKSKEAQSKI